MVLENLSEITTPKELAEFLKISEQTVKRAIKSGKLKALKVARDWRIERNEVIKWVKGENK